MAPFNHSGAGSSHRRWGDRRIRMWAALVAAGAFLAVATLTNPGAAQQTTDEKFSNDDLIIQSRDRLAVCVQPTSTVGLSAAEVRDSVEAILASAAQDPGWAPRGFAKGPVAVDVGCPTSPVLLVPGVQVSGTTRMTPVNRQTARPSKYRLHVYILPSSNISALFGSDRYPLGRVEAEQFICIPDARCDAVTDGLYVSEGETKDNTYLRSAVEGALGLSVPPPPPTPTGRRIGTRPADRRSVPTATPSSSPQPSSHSGGDRDVHPTGRAIVPSNPDAST